MKFRTFAAAFAAATLQVSFAMAEPVFWGVSVEQLEHRFGDDGDVFAWDFDASAGTDELKFVWRSEAEYLIDENGFETLENQGRIQVPISNFFDFVAGGMVNSPEGANRGYGLVGIHGLAPQWFELDLDLFISDDPFVRFEADYEALITNRVILTPSIEINLPFSDDEGAGHGAWGPIIEVGARLSYDLVDRAISPYVGVHYERAFGDSGDLRRDDGEDRGEFFGVLGARLLF